jgi:Tol biopolymer transport system component
VQSGPAQGQLKFGPATQLVIPGSPSGPSGDSSPSLASDNLTLYFQSPSRSPSLGDYDIYQTTRATPTGSFETPTNLELPVNTSSLDGNEKISRDGLSLYFNSDRPGTAGEVDIYVATRATTSAAFGNPVRLDSLNTAFRDGAPDISADGLSIIFTTNKPGGLGNRDIYMATRATTADPFGSIINLGPTVNTADEERFPTLASNGLSIIFASDREGGLGDYDLWMTTRASLAAPWDSPVNLGPNVNSAFTEDTPDIAWDGASLVFASQRTGSSRIYQAMVVPEPSTILLVFVSVSLLLLENR